MESSALVEFVSPSEFRSLVEVTWVQAEHDPGVGLRLPSLTPFDLEFLQSAHDKIGQPMVMGNSGIGYLPMR